MFFRKMFFVCFGLACLISALGYWFLAGFGSLHPPTDSTRIFITGAFGVVGLLSFYGSLYPHRPAHNELIAQNAQSPASGNVYYLFDKR